MLQLFVPILFCSHIIKPISPHVHSPPLGLGHKAQCSPRRKRVCHVEQNFSTLIFGFVSFFAIGAIPVHCRMFSHIPG